MKSKGRINVIIDHIAHVHEDNRHHLLRLFLSAKGPHIFAKELFISVKEPYISEGPYIYARESCICAKKPIVYIRKICKKNIYLLKGPEEV